MRRLLGIDYAWGGPPSPALMRRSGISFVGRYFSWVASKNITAAEYGSLSRSGIDVVTVWEMGAERARGGRAAGVEDAAAAETQRRQCGMPDGQPMHLAVDFEAQGPEVDEYFRGARSVLGERTGAYGGFGALGYLFDRGLIDHGWQTLAWSGGRWHPRAMVRQYSNSDVFDGVQVDWDVMLAPKPVNPLDVLLEPERDAADSYLTYLKNPRLHAHGLKVEYEALVTFRKAIWVAAERGRLQNGQQTARGWDKFARAARYRELWRLTGRGDGSGKPPPVRQTPATTSVAATRVSAAEGAAAVRGTSPAGLPPAAAGAGGTTTLPQARPNGVALAQAENGLHPYPGFLLREGVTGPEVRSWQERMNEIGWPIAVDGIYGPQSDAACSQLQEHAGLAVDGAVGPATWQAAFADSP